MNILKLLVATALTFAFIGCAAHCKLHYEKEIDNLGLQKVGAKINLNAGWGENKDTLRERTMAKYEKAPFYGDSINGFDGVIANTKWCRATFTLSGRRGIDLAPISLGIGDTVHQCLMPDDYDYTIVDEYGDLKGYGVLTAGPRVATYVYKHQPVRTHWFLYW